MQDYHKIDAWCKAHPLSLDVRRAVAGIPRRGYSDLKRQLLTAADSIASNIVEGCGAFSRKEFARFLEMSIKSAMELQFRCESAASLFPHREAEWKTLAARTVEVRKMVYKYREAVLRADAEEEASKRRGRGNRGGARDRRASRAIDDPQRNAQSGSD